MSHTRNHIPAVPVGSSELNQGPTVPSQGRDGARQMRLPNNTNNNNAKVTILNVATYNVRTLSEELHLTSLENEIRKINWDVIGISEMRRLGEKVIELPNGNIMFHRGNENKKQGGVGFLVHKKLKGNIEEFHATSDRVASLTIKISKRYKIKIVQVYAPTSLSTQEELDEFYDDLQTEMQHKKAHYNIVMGDFNAKVGTGDENCVGRFGYGTRNERGDDLVNFAIANNFKIANTFFKKKPSRRWTWRSPDFETFNEIDYVLTDKLNIVTNIEILNKVNVDSDHRMVRCRIHVNTKIERQKLFHSKPQPLRVSKQFINEFKLDLRNRFAPLEDPQEVNNITDNINDLNNNIIEPLISAAINWKDTSTKVEKFSEETKDLMNKRRNLKAPTTAREKIELAELNKLIRKKQRQDVRKHRTTVVHEVIQQGKGFKMAKRKLNQGRLQFTGVQEADGTITTDRERIVERAHEFYGKLYSSTRLAPVEQEQQTREEPEIHHRFENFPDIEEWEVRHCVKQSKKGKAPGPDNVTIDLIEAAGELVYGKLANLFNECLYQTKIPDMWNEAIIILLLKKGDPTDMSNYRPISLLNNIYKLFTKIITNRITSTLDENQPREQAGFRKGFSTTDHLHAVNQLIEKCAEYKIPLAIALVDYNKAFDSVEIPDVIEALQDQGVDPVYINVLKHIYNNAKSFIRLHKDSKPFQLGRGVRQGDTSSPKLFTACLEKVFRRLDWETKGIKIDGESLNHLRFADDIILFASNFEDLQEMLQELNQASLEVGLSMNLKKTKIMSNQYTEDIDNDQPITINNNIIETVDHYIYLGQRISMDSTSKELEVKRRITLGWQAFGRASSIFKSKDMPIVLKRQVYDQCITPTVTYGAETWNLTKKQTLKLRTMQRAHERIMLNITWRDHKTANWIREQTKIRDILKVISKAKWTWAGHVARRDDNRWTTRLTFWQPRGHTRNRGRQKTRWRDDLDKFHKHWPREARRDRAKWHTMGKAYVQLRTYTG